MPAWGWVVVVVVALALIGVAAWAAWQRQRRQRLRERFGPEYERAVEGEEDRRRAEAELAERERRRESLEIRPLDPAAADRYLVEWREIQASFVDRPVEAVRDADRVITDVMRDRGYPMDSFDQRAADISVDHPGVVDDYRSAHAVSVASDRGNASTEDLRRAMVHYRSLFDALLVEERPPEEAG